MKFFVQFPGRTPGFILKFSGTLAHPCPKLLKIHKGFKNINLECHSVIRERSRRYGQSSKDRDLAKWAKARRRMVRREDIFSTLIGKPPPTRATASFSKSLSHSQLANEALQRSRNSPQRRSPRPSTSTAASSKSQRRNSLLNKDLSHLQVC